ncbi:MAG: hydrogenase maturation nickel metallochaperone HypA [Pseudomonadota bacterium]
MHELAVAENIVHIVREEMRKAGLAKLNVVYLKVGEFTHLMPDALRFCFEVSVQKNTPLQGATLHIEVVPTLVFCHACESEFHLEGCPVFICPRCAGTDVEVRAGREMSIEAIDAD